MVEEQNETTQAKPKRRLPKKMLIVIAIVMVVEGAMIFGGVMIWGEKPPSVQAEGVKSDPEARQRDTVSLLLIGDKFQNTRQGAQSYLYDATIYISVERRYETRVGDMITEKTPRISQAIAEIFSRAEPAQLNEPNRLTLKRQIQQACEEIFGTDADGEPYVREVIISNWVRHSTDI